MKKTTRHIKKEVPGGAVPKNRAEASSDESIWLLRLAVAKHLGVCGRATARWLSINPQEFQEMVGGISNESVAWSLKNHQPGNGSLPGWAAMFGRNLMRGEFRVHHRHRRALKALQLEVGNGAAPSEFQPGAQQKSGVQDLSGLSFRHREALCLFYLCGFSVAEMAAYYDQTENAVKVLLHRARQKARKFLTQVSDRSRPS